MAEKSSGFFFDVKEWHGSRSVQRMTFAERGVYFEMMLEQWDKRNLPDDAQAVADAIATTPAQVAEVLAAWDVVRRKFVTSRGDPTRLYNVRLEKTRRQQRLNRISRQVAGSKGGKAKASKHYRRDDLPSSNATAMLERALAKPSDQTRPEETRPDQTRPEVHARSKRPIFSGQRLTVFEWQLDDCMKALGDHTNGFDLHEWFCALDGLAVRSGLVIPKRDGGVWLQQQLVAEAQRRGLPLRMATTTEALGKQSTRLLSAVAGLKP